MNSKFGTFFSFCVAASMLSACGVVKDDNRSSDVSSTDEQITGLQLEKSKKGDDWYSGWNKLIDNKGIEYGKLPWGKQPKTINAKVMKKKKPIKLTDYWLRPTGWTTMWGHTLEKYDNPKYRTDGVRWDTPTQWVPQMVGGYNSGGNLTLVTQFGPDVPSYWSGAKPYSAQTDWIFHVDYKTGAIMEIYDRQHFKHKDGTISPSFSEVAAKSYKKAIYWSPSWKLPIGPRAIYGGKAAFVSNKGKKFAGYTSLTVTNRFETFTVPPSRNKGGDCPAATFEDVIALRHEQWWYDKDTGKSRGDFLVIYMAKGVGWIHQLLNDSVEVDASGTVVKDSEYFMHMSPVGYITQGGDWARKCPHEYRDMLKKR